MIELTSLIGKTVFVNPDLIRSIESAPDTILCFVDGTRIPVRETPKQIQDKVIQFKQLVFQVGGKGLTTWE
jgi:flagellar protein FlbD